MGMNKRMNDWINVERNRMLPDHAQFTQDY